MESTQGQRSRNNSEVARLLQQIREEYTSAVLGLSGLAEGTSKHEVINAKLERISNLHQELQTYVGDEAMTLVVQHMELAPAGESLSL
jgi:hypothetical protein